MREVRKLSRALGSFKWEGRDAEGHHQGIPMHHARGGSERYSDRGGVRDEEGRIQGITQNLNLLSLGGRSRAGSMRDNNRENFPHHSNAGSRRGSGNALDVEKGHGEWGENGENVDVRRRSGAV